LRTVKERGELYERIITDPESSNENFIRAYVQTVLDGIQPNWPYIKVGMAEAFLLEALDLPDPTEIRAVGQFAI